MRICTSEKRYRRGQPGVSGKSLWTSRERVRVLFIVVEALFEEYLQQKRRDQRNILLSPFQSPWRNLEISWWSRAVWSSFWQCHTRQTGPRFPTLPDRSNQCLDESNMRLRKFKSCKKIYLHKTPFHFQKTQWHDNLHLSQEPWRQRRFHWKEAKMSKIWEK